MILRSKFHDAYVADSYTQQYEKYQKIADEYALAFAIYIEAAEEDDELKDEIRSCFETFKEKYK